MRVETISYLKKNIAELNLEGEAMTITQNGIPAYVIESYAERKRRDDALALLKLLSFSDEDHRQGRVISNETLKERLAARKAALKEGKHE